MEETPISSSLVSARLIGLSDLTGSAPVAATAEQGDPARCVRQEGTHRREGVTDRIIRVGVVDEHVATSRIVHGLQAPGGAVAGCDASNDRIG